MRLSSGGLYVAGLILFACATGLFMYAATISAEQGVSSSAGLSSLRLSLHGLGVMIFGGLLFVAGAVVAASQPPKS